MDCGKGPPAIPTDSDGVLMDPMISNNRHSLHSLTLTLSSSPPQLKPIDPPMTR